MARGEPVHASPLPLAPDHVSGGHVLSSSAYDCCIVAAQKGHATATLVFLLCTAYPTNPTPKCTRVTTAKLYSHPGCTQQPRAIVWQCTRIAPGHLQAHVRIIAKKSVVAMLAAILPRTAHCPTPCMMAACMIAADMAWLLAVPRMQACAHPRSTCGSKIAYMAVHSTKTATLCTVNRAMHLLDV